MEKTCLWCNGNFYEGFECRLCTDNLIEEDNEETLAMSTDKNKDPRLERAGVSDYNKPKHTPDHPTKSHVVVAKEGDKIKTVRFGEQNPKTEEDVVNKPKHYNQYGVECIDAIKAATGEHFEGYLQGNIIKYVWRYRYKNDVEDLQKAQVYAKWLEEHRKEKL